MSNYELLKEKLGTIQEVIYAFNYRCPLIAPINIEKTLWEI